MKKKLFSVLLLFSTLIGFTQADSALTGKPARKIRFQSFAMIGLLEGETGTSFQGQAMAGLAWRSWFAGVGAGIDYYSFRSFPVIMDVRKNLFKGRKTPFVYADGGLNFPWAKKKTETFVYTGDYKYGWYYDIGAGYSLQTQKSGTWLISLGFSEKTYSQDLSYQAFTGDIIYRNSEPFKNHFEYQLRRISLKAGVRF